MYIKIKELRDSYAETHKQQQSEQIDDNMISNRRSEMSLSCLSGKNINEFIDTVNRITSRSPFDDFSDNNDTIHDPAMIYTKHIDNIRLQGIHMSLLKVIFFNLLTRIFRKS